METPFALNSLTLRQRARWRVRSQVSWRKTCKASALYTIGIHAFFINLQNTIPLQFHESPPFTPRSMPKVVFVSAGCSTTKEKSRTFYNGFSCIIMLCKVQELYRSLRYVRFFSSTSSVITAKVNRFCWKCAQKVRRQLRSLDRYCDGPVILLILVC